jgi:hypothetical protein
VQAGVKGKVVRVVIGGERGSGKSTFSASIYSHLLENGMDVNIHEVDVYSDTVGCILGRKEWSERRKRKHAWFNPTIKRRIDEFNSDEHQLVLGDLPGKITNPFLSKMIAPAHAAVIVSKSMDGIVEWERYFARHGKTVLLCVQSFLAEPIKVEGGVLPVWGLDRKIIRTPEIVAIAREIHARAHALHALSAA